MELYLEEGKLISEEKWVILIENLKKEVESKPTIDYEQAKEELKTKIIEAIKKRIPNEKYAICFSGGVDSSFIALICKKLNPNFTCYTVGYKEVTSELPEDIVFAEKIAIDLNLELETKLFNLEESEKIIKETIELLPKTKEVDVGFMVNVGVGSVVVAISKIGKENLYFTGLGSEELFAGYERHSKAEDKHEECWSGLKQMRGRDLIRDVTLTNKLGVKLATPLLDKDVIIAAMRIDISKKIDSNHKKIVFREIAEEEGLQKEYSWRKKKGAQYGSKFDRAISKLAKKNNLKFKKDYIKSII